MRLSSFLAPLSAGFITVLVGFTSSAAIVFQAAQAAGADARTIGSWMLALGVGMGLTCIGLSWRYRMPIVTAWSTPGAVLLATSLHGVTPAQATGAFVFSGILVVLAGATGWFERVIGRVPLSLAAALLAGVLCRFALESVGAVVREPVLVLTMFAIYLAGKRWFARYAVILVLLGGLGLAALTGRVRTDAFAALAPGDWLAAPVWVGPEFALPVLIGVGLPLFIVTMASQNVPGVAVLRASGYAPPVSAVVGWTGVATVLLAPFGGYAFNLAAITAALCTGEQAHEDPAKRWIASAAAGAFYLVLGLLGASVALLFGALPGELIVAIAGIALLATIAGGLQVAMADETWREASLVSFLVTLSGVQFASIGSAFWGLVAGIATALALRRARPRVPPQNNR
ncbi:MAG: benzoate/H(+) symporter BenE family transporter [Lautropia sp.]